jgi:hypothetical protein
MEAVTGTWGIASYVHIWRYCVVTKQTAYLQASGLCRLAGSSMVFRPCFASFFHRGRNPLTGYDMIQKGDQKGGKSGQVRSNFLPSVS